MNRILSTESTPAAAGANDRSARAAPTGPLASVVRPSWNWIPIRSLGPRHRGRIAAHLSELDPEDRYFRFGYAITDSQISKYVDILDFEHDEVFGIFNRRLVLIAMAHLAHSIVAPRGTGKAMSEFGVSVSRQARGRGFGRRLFERAMLHARNRSVGTLLIHALSENVAMLKIARRAGATVVREGAETDAWLELPPDSFASHVDELIERRAAEIDYRLKLRARRTDAMSDANDPSLESVARGADD